jgi:hypothetical protein
VCGGLSAGDSVTFDPQGWQDHHGQNLEASIIFILFGDFFMYKDNWL